VWIALLALALCGRRAGAECNVIPGASQIQRGAIGVADRPFASPGDLVGIEVNPAVCDTSSPGIGATATGADHALTVLFTPTQGADSALVLAADCAAVSTASCASLLGGPARVRCVEVPTAGPSPGLFVGPPDSVGRRRLYFRMPESAGPFGEPRDLTGPAKIVVTRSGDPLRCEFATTPCTSAGGFSPGLVACIDQLFDLDGTCGTSTAQLGKTFRHFTVLPRPNAYADVCSLDQNDPLAGRCSGDAGELLFTTDVDGNVLVPWDYRDVLLRVGGVPVPRIGRGRAVFDPFASDVVVESLFLPKDGFFSSYAPEGLRLPPIFTPIADTSSAATLFGTIDAARGVMRLARRSPIFGECVDPTSAPHPRGIPCFQTQTGSALVDDCPSGFHCGDAVCYAGRTPTATPCDEDPDCGAGEECGPSLFELRDRHAQGGIGPVVLSRATPSGDAAGSFDAVELREAVPLDGLNESQEIFAFVLNEEISGQAQTGLDQNNDGDALDFRVRAFRLGSSTELLSAANLVANPQPRIDGWALALSDELLFFTANEMHAMPVIPERITNAAPSDTLRDVSVSGDGQHVAYQGNDDGIYVWSRATGATVQVDLDPSGVPLLGQAAHTSISEDGRE
jgi:hypothetical protein